MRETTDLIAPSLTELFNKSLRLGCLPEDWKLANIVLVFKKYNKEQRKTTDRSRSKFLLFLKWWRGAYIFNAIRDHFFNLISVCQHGFIAERLCVTQLVEVLGKLAESWIEEDIRYPDMWKAFVTANHAKLLRKLHQYGFRGNLLTWLEPYLHNRSQRVTILGTTSSLLPVTSGVPQGSILGPILFLMYVNSLPDVVRSKQIAAFVDGTKVFKEITSTRDAEQLQEDLSGLITWSDSASLNVNYSKCKAQRITRKLKSVSFVYHMAGSVVTAGKYLGVYITDNLTWNKQINEQCAKARRLVGYCMEKHQTREKHYG